MPSVTGILYLFLNKITIEFLPGKDFNLKKSEAALARAVKLAPNMAQVFLAKSHYYSDVEGDELLAYNEIEKANNTKPNDHNILVHLAERLSKKNDYKNALAVCEQIYRLDPKSHSGPYYASGNALALGRNDEALR